MKKYRLLVTRPVTDTLLFKLQKRKFLFWWETKQQTTQYAAGIYMRYDYRPAMLELLHNEGISPDKVSFRYRK